ncbi:MAG TPA: glycosyltransferase family 4 protein [Verrucomicrobiae bacterium]|jgi:glycosyltransferase involved in cell wall biosynthesis
MRLAYVNADPGVPVWGSKGASIHVQEVLRALVSRGLEVTLLATNCDGARPAEVDSIGLVPLPSLPKSAGVERERAALAANDSLRAELERLDCDTVYERHSLWSFAAMEFARDRGLPGVLEVNAPLVEEQAKHRGLHDRAAAEHAAQRAFAAASAIIAVSDELATWLETQPGARGKVHAVPNGINPARFPANLQPSSPAPRGTFTIGFVGTLKPWHGLPVLVEAFTQFARDRKNVRLLIVGDGPERGAMEASLAAHGLLNSAHFTGLVTPNAVPGFIASMDVAVAPYPPMVNFYFSPLKVYEYMAAARAVVASRIGQLEKLIEHERTGLLVPPGDAAALAGAFARLANDAALRQSLGDNARAFVLREHTWDSVAEKILALLNAKTAAVNV